MKNLTEIIAIVREYLGDSSALVTQPIIDTINYLSNIFALDSIDETQSTVSGNSFLTLPDNYIHIDSVFVDSNEIRPLNNLADLQTAKDNFLLRWYVFGNKIQFTQTFDKIYPTSIYYRKGFSEPTTILNTDVPVNLLELVYLGAIYRYYNYLITQSVLNRDIVVDIEPKELKQIREDLQEQFFELIKSIQINS